MPKYRMLYREELEELRIDFVRFLSAHSITSEEWEKMKANDKKKSMQWIELFSDMVMDTVLKKIDLLELRSESEIKFLTFDEKNTYMVGIRVGGVENIDLSANEDPSAMIAKFQSEGGELRIITGERPNESERETEVYKNLSLGYLISKNKALYESLLEIIENQKN